MQHAKSVSPRIGCRWQPRLRYLRGAFRADRPAVGPPWNKPLRQTLLDPSEGRRGWPKQFSWGDFFTLLAGASV